MIKVTTKNGHNIYISLCNDTNKGEYHFDVYLNEDDFINIDSFVIHKKDLDCFEENEVDINAICEAYAKEFDDTPYLNREFNEIYQKISNAYDEISEFYLKHIFYNEKCNPAHKQKMADLFDKMGDVKELAHDIVEHYTWD